MADVLILDDNTELLEVYDSLFQMEGHRVFVASNKQGVLDIIEINKQISVALIDIFIAGTCTFDLFNELKEKIPKIKLVAMSATIDTEIKEQALQNGADIYVSKPFSVDEICNDKNIFVS